MLNKHDVEILHHITMELQYLSQHGWPDICTALLFLCTRVKAPEMDEYKKLAHISRYLQGMVNLTLCLSADRTGILQWWVDASYAVHPNMKSHTEGTMSLGSSSVYSMSTKQKLMTQSCTGGELVGVHEMMPQIMWTQYFLEARGFGMCKVALYQDNKSTIWEHL